MQLQHGHHASPEGDEAALLTALRAGDEAAFARLVGRYHGPMLRVARAYVATREAAEDVVQEAWMGVTVGSIASRVARR